MEHNDKQVHIIETAEKLFALHGFAGTSIRDISREAGINIAMVSYYFGSKEKLMEAIFHHRITHAWIAAEEMADNNKLQPWQKVEELIHSFVEGMSNKSYFHSLILRQQLSNELSPIASLMDSVRERNTNIIGKIIREGQANGDFKQDVDIPLLLFTMVGTAYQTLHSRESYRKMHNLQHMTDEAFMAEMKRRLKQHIFFLFKAILS